MNKLRGLVLVMAVMAVTAGCGARTSSRVHDSNIVSIKSIQVGDRLQEFDTMDNDFLELILNQLKLSLKSYKSVTHFSKNPGIYAIGFIAGVFPLSSAKNYVKPGDIIYIGKTEKSQECRNVSTHLASGKSGCSIVRRTLGAILREQLSLQPIPRSFTEKGDKRFTNYKFDSTGEDRLLFG